MQLFLVAVLTGGTDDETDAARRFELAEDFAEAATGFLVHPQTGVGDRDIEAPAVRPAEPNVCAVPADQLNLTVDTSVRPDQDRADLPPRKRT